MKTVKASSLKVNQRFYFGPVSIGGLKVRGVMFDKATNTVGVVVRSHKVQKRDGLTIIKFDANDDIQKI